MLLLCGPLWAADGTVSIANAGPHGRLELALNGHALVARLTLPAMQVVGFNQAPTDGEEKRAVNEALQRLGKADNVLVPVAAGCAITREEAGSSLVPPSATKALATKTPEAGAGDVFHGRYAWHCSNPAALQAVSIPLLEFMNGVALDILVVSGGEQHRSTLRFPDTRLLLGSGG